MNCGDSPIPFHELNADCRRDTSMSVSAHGRTVSLPKHRQTRCAKARISPAISTRFGSSSLAGKNIPLLIFRKSASFTRIPPHRRGAYASSRYVECGERWTRWRCARHCRAASSFVLGCERSIRAGRAALLRTAKACGSGTRGWCQAGGGCSNPTGFVGPSIRQRRRQEEFVSGKSAP